MHLQMIGHVIVMVAFISQCTKKIKHAGTSILALFTEIVLEIAREEFQEVHLRSNDLPSYRLQTKKGLGWRITRFEFKVVRDIAQEIETI